MPDIQDLFKFLDHMRRFQAVIRKLRIQGREEEENDVEHSYTLAMCAWYLNSSHNLGFDTSKLVIYSLVHDLPEIYVLDVHIGDAEGKKNKAAKEASSIARFASELPEFPELFRWIHAYEARQDAESQFVYQLDKLIPSMIVFREGGSTWRELNFEIEWLNNFRRGKITSDPTLMMLNGQLEAVIGQYPEMFNRVCTQLSLGI